MSRKSRLSGTRGIFRCRHPPPAPTFTFLHIILSLLLCCCRSSSSHCCAGIITNKLLLLLLEHKAPSISMWSRVLRTSLLSRRGVPVKSTALKHVVVFPSSVRTMSSNNSAPEAPSSFGHDKMESDKRYQVSQDVPESLLIRGDFSSEFSIQGQFKEGRAAYLDMSSTTPLDPRVVDKMAPYMVCFRW